MSFATFVLVLLLCIINGNWPGFLGAGAGARNVQDLPLQWSPESGVAWVRQLPGHGQSSPVLWGDRVFVTSVEGPQKDTYHTVCCELATGKEVWRQTLRNSSPVQNSYYVSRAAPTPVVDDALVVVLFESGQCAAYSHDGDLLWEQDLGRSQGPLTAEFGLGASLCQTESQVYVLLEHDGPSALLALEKQSGNIAWKANRTPRRSWSSPAVVWFSDRPLIVVSSGGSIDMYDALTGAILAEFDDIGGNTGTTPIDLGDGSFLVGASPGRSGENAGPAADSNCLMRIQQIDGRYEMVKQWVAEGATPTWASPIVHEGLAYWINRAGVVFAFDAATGDKVYAERTSQACWATPFAVGDRIYLFGKEGTVTVLAAGRSFKVLAENQTWNADTLPAEAPLGEETTAERRRAAAMFAKPTLYGAAVSPDAFLIRVGNALIKVSE